MPRAIVALIVTVAVVVLIANFRTTTTRVALAPPSPAASPSPSPSPAASPAPSPRHAKTPARRRARTIAGAPVQQPYGTVQVSVTINGGRITDVRTLAVPLDSGRSQAINSQAAPMLRQEALRVQSARIDVISGATYTSDAYAQSLQSALDQARG